MEYDSETGNYYDMARYYSPRLGRFMSPDPADLAAVNPANPQSWNRYSYALNNPTSLTDPTGLSSTPDEFSENGMAAWAVGWPQYQDIFDQLFQTVPLMTCVSASGTYAPPSGSCSVTYQTEYNPAAASTYDPAIPQGPGGALNGIPSTPNSAGAQAQGTQSSACTALQWRASRLGLTLRQMSHASGLGAGALGLLAIGSGVGEFFTAGGDTPFTLALLGGAGGFALTSKGAGSLAAALESAAGGNPAPLEHFGISQLADVALKLEASSISPVAEFGAKLAETVQQALDLAKATRGVCQQ